MVTSYSVPERTLTVLTIRSSPRVSSGLFGVVKETVVWAFAILLSMLETVTFVFVAGSFWSRKVSTGLYRKDITHVENLEDLVEVQLPGGDRLLVVLRAEVPRDRIPFIPLD